MNYNPFGSEDKRRLKKPASVQRNKNSAGSQKYNTVTGQASTDIASGQREQRSLQSR